ncbi:putative cytochrome P450 [Melanomma pulvis-pyrius CBS 109.77]|uniref:Putative cytochrome P450 n=1 Tax=Melanomma pulvis-pyrius CBS 109.77 TaxID=1314802 RepID=A0A6A6XJR9_9PLEO|nr:putative cytochrome P450 [Melanomma pulvis-pyrius CBS 109.77]
MFSSGWLVYLGCGLPLLWILVIVVQNVFFHPLSSFPGPLLARASLLWRFWSTLGGTFHKDLYKIHDRYGPVVRISPNELSFASLGSWKDIYGFPTHGQDPMIKSNFYKLLRSGFDSGCIGCEQNPDEHRRMKSSLSAAFSTKALLEQEYIVNRVIDSFVDKIGSEVKAKGHVDMAKWFEMMAFDLMGEMTFGESFQCIENGERHSWIKLILDHLFFVTVADNLRRLAIFNTFAMYLAPLVNIVQKEHIQFTREKVRRRLESKSPRKDFVTNLVSKVDSGEISIEELSAHSSTLIIAGGETVASSMSGLLFCLLSPSSAKSYSILRQEVRSRFSKYSDIDFMSIQKLPYLQAVIKEGLRTFSNGHPLPRVCPGRRIDGVWVPAGTEVYTSPWPVNHNPEYFTRPLEFLPERWLDSSRENSEFTADILNASQPFQLGPRGCLGRNFAMMEISLSLAKLVWKYDLELANPNDDWADHVKIHVLWWKPELAIRVTDVAGSLDTIEDVNGVQGLI